MLIADALRPSPDETQLAAQVRRALSFRHVSSTLSPDESATCVNVWSVRELDDVYAHIGGTVTARPVTRRTFDGTLYDVIELVLAAELAGLGAVAVVTDWDPADEVHGFALPVVQALSDTV